MGLQLCCVIWIKWVWKDHSWCYALCDLNQVGVMGSQLMLCVVWFESSGCDGITADDVRCVIWIKWVWWDHSWCYALCDLNQVGVMGSQQVLCAVWFESSGCDGMTAVMRLIRCIVCFELGGCDGITAGAMCCVSSVCDGITAGAVWFESSGCDGITAGAVLCDLSDHDGMRAGAMCYLNQMGVMGSQQVLCVVWFESNGCDGITAGTMCYVIWIKWVWWDHSWCYVLCDSSQVDVMGSDWVLFCVFQMVWLWCCTRWCWHSSHWRTSPLTRLFWASSSSLSCALGVSWLEWLLGLWQLFSPGSQ